MVNIPSVVFFSYLDCSLLGPGQGMFLSHHEHYAQRK